MDRRSFLSDSPALAVAAAIGAQPSKAVAAGLLDADAVRASLPRLFSGAWDEIISELLQNSQRAGAKNVTVNLEAVANKVVLTWADDGCGIDGSAGSFRNLLAIGASGWEDEVKRNQSPLGLGLHALLAQEDVRRVVISGGGREIEIARDRWWTDPPYYTAWQELIRSSPDRPGLQLQVTMVTNPTERRLSELVSDIEEQAPG